MRDLFDRLTLTWDLRTLRGVGLGVLVLACIVAWQVSGSDDQSAAAVRVERSGMPLAGSSAQATVAASPSGQQPSDQPSELVVEVVGPVRRPGLVRVPAGARVADAIKAAGGLTHGQAVINQARLLVDGEQVVVGQAASSGDGSTVKPGSSTGEQAGKKINLNTATATELETLPRVGPVMAQKIVAWRTEHGRFASIDQLKEVAGVGEVTFAGLKSLVTV